MKICNYLTIDVEDYYQVSAFESIVPKSSWGTYPSRVEQNTRKILSILEKNDVRATFFILGWTAEKYPGLVKEIDAYGHEIGCHSYCHRLVYTLTPEVFRRETKKAKDILEQIIGKPISGYRAPSYSITEKSIWALGILHELGFTYDSSIFPIHHDRYGIPTAPRHPFSWDLSQESPRAVEKANDGVNPAMDRSLVEYPISTVVIFGKNVPVSGGGYFRLFPYWFTRSALKKINTVEKKSFIFYLHPWELDPQQPRFSKAGMLSKFRHYNNLHKTEERFALLLKDFSFAPMHIQNDNFPVTQAVNSQKVSL